MMDYLDRDTVLKLAQSFLLAAAALGLFFGLKGRMQSVGRLVHLPEFAFKPIRLVFRYLILAAGILLLLGVWGFPVNAVIAVLGTMLGLVAIGFVAMWSVLSNFLCTFVLIMFRPFAVGDDLEVPADNVKGRVIDLSLVFTTLEVKKGETVIIPNNTFFQKIFKRHAGHTRIELEDQLGREEAHQPQAALS